MKTYKILKESLPSNTIVFTFGRFNPPTIGHQLLLQFIKKTAAIKKADHVVFISRKQDAKKNPLSVERKLYYLNLMFKDINFASATTELNNFLAVAKFLNKKYKNIIMVVGSDRVDEFSKTLNKYNGAEYNFNSISVLSAGERDPDADDASGMSATKLRMLASKGDFLKFKQGLPGNIRLIDARRLMNDIREGMGLEVIKEQLKIPFNNLREKYIKGEIYNIGDIVESANIKYEIVKRGTNYLLVKDAHGDIKSKWLTEVYREDING